MADNSSELQWFVASTTTGYENKVKTKLENKIKNLGLQDQIIEIKIPTITYEVTDKKGNVKIKEEKVSPNYVYINMVLNEKTRQCVVQTENVINFVGPNNDPTPLSTEEVKRLGIIVPVTELEFKIGDHVEILNGFLSGSNGVISKISDDKKSVTVLASVFGRETPVDIAIQDIKKI